MVNKACDSCKIADLCTVKKIIDDLQVVHTTDPTEAVPEIIHIDCAISCDRQIAQ